MNADVLLEFLDNELERIEGTDIRQEAEYFRGFQDGARAEILRMKSYIKAVTK